MPLNLSDRIAVRPLIVPRCTAAVTNYALYLLNLPTATVNQKAWANEAIRAPESIGQQVSWYVLSEPAYIADGSTIGDAAITGRVENVINLYFIQA